MLKEKLTNTNYNFSVSGFRKICGILLFFSLPINQKTSTILMFMCLILTLIDYKSINFDKLKKNWPLLLFYFAFIIIGSLLREDFKFKYIEYKTPFLVIPIIFHNYSAKDFVLFAKSYVIGLLVFYAGLWMIALSNVIHFNPFVFDYKVNPNTYGFIENGVRGGNYFLGEYFTNHLQTSYFALYYALGIILLYSLDIFKAWHRNVVALLLIFAILQSFSKAGMLLLLFSVLYLLFHSLRSKRWPALILSSVLIAIIAFSNPRIHQSVNSFLENGIQLNERSPESVDMRLLTWDASYEAIKNKPVLGYGSTEARYKLNKIYSEKNYRFPLRYQLNAHNLYLQLAVEGGFVLLLIFIAVQCIPFFRFGNRSLILGFTVLSCISFIFESHFSRYLGISFFALFYTLILNFYEDKN